MAVTNKPKLSFNAWVETQDRIGRSKRRLSGREEEGKKIQILMENAIFGRGRAIRAKKSKKGFVSRYFHILLLQIGKVCEVENSGSETAH